MLDVASSARVREAESRPRYPTPRGDDGGEAPVGVRASGAFHLCEGGSSLVGGTKGEDGVGDRAAVFAADVCGLGWWRERGLLSVWAASGSGRSGCACSGLGWHARSESGAEVSDTLAGAAGDAACGHDHAAGWEACRLLRDLDAAVCAADSPGGAARDDGVGVRRGGGESNRGLLVHNAPSLTIEAMWNRPVRVKWINELVDGNGHFLPHLLPVDPTLHWANRPAAARSGTAGRRSGRHPVGYRPSANRDARAWRGRCGR